jgi:hypothetical protein
MGSDAVCLLIGPLVSFVVSALKRIPFVKRFPKSAAFFISSLVGAYTSAHGSTPGIDYAAIIQCVLVQFATAVATHEAIVQPVTDKLVKGDGPNFVQS